MTEWRPVVGGRCVWDGRVALVVGILPWGDWIIIVPDGERRVGADSLREHPDDRRARRLLESAREAGKTWAAMRGAKAPKLQALVKMEHAAAIKDLRAIVAEIDQAEADHAS